MVETDTPKVFATSALGIPRSTAASTLSLRSFEYAFMSALSHGFNTQASRCQKFTCRVPARVARMSSGLITFNTKNHSNAWCEMRSPLEQVSEGQPRTTKLVVEPDAEVVQRNPGRQASPQPAQLMGSLRAKAKGIVELLVNRLDDLANACRPTPQPLGPSPFAPVLSGWAHDA